MEPSEQNPNPTIEDILRRIIREELAAIKLRPREALPEDKLLTAPEAARRVDALALQARQYPVLRGPVIPDSHSVFAQPGSAGDPKEIEDAGPRAVTSFPPRAVVDKQYLSD